LFCAKLVWREKETKRKGNTNNDDDNKNNYKDDDDDEVNDIGGYDGWCLLQMQERERNVEFDSRLRFEVVKQVDYQTHKLTSGTVPSIGSLVLAAASASSSLFNSGLNDKQEESHTTVAIDDRYNILTTTNLYTRLFSKGYKL